MSKILGKVGRNAIVLDKDDVGNALVLVDALPDPSTTGWGCVQMRVSGDGFVAGDIFKLENGVWKKVAPSSGAVGSVYGIISPAYDNDVRIRWHDPVNKDAWKLTRIIRKYGSYPVNEYDGVIVADSYVHDYYVDHVLHDFVPNGTVNNWFYRAFICNKSEGFSSTNDCMFRPIEFTLENLPQIIRDGNGPKVLAVGDVIMPELDSSIEFEVGGFDTVEPEDASRTHSMVLVSTKAIYKMPYDIGWPEYSLTSDTRVMDRSKIYYLLSGYDTSGRPVYTQAPAMRLGSPIPENTYYERNTNAARIAIGGNRWSKSNLRTKLQDTLIDMTSGYVPPAKKFPELDKIVAKVMVRTTLPTSDGNGAEYTADRYFIPSLTEVFGRNPYREWYSKTTDTTPREIYLITEDTVRDMEKTYFIFSGGVYRIATDSSFAPDGSFIEGVDYYELMPKEYYIQDGEDSYRLAGDDDFTPAHDFIDDVEYFEKNVLNINENGHLPSFDNEVLEPRKKSLIGTVTPIKWWLRSADIATDTDVLVVDELGNQISSPCNAELGVVVACVIA